MALTDIAKKETRPMNGPEERKDGKPGEEPEDIELFTQWVDGTVRHTVTSISFGF